MLQLPVLRHCFSSYNSHDLLLVLDIAQTLAHLWANTVLMVSPFSIKHQNINKFLHLFKYLKSIAEMVYDELCWHLKHQKSPISKFIIIFSKQFFLFSLSLSYYRLYFSSIRNRINCKSMEVSKTTNTSSLIMFAETHIRRQSSSPINCRQSFNKHYPKL